MGRRVALRIYHRCEGARAGYAWYAVSRGVQDRLVSPLVRVHGDDHLKTSLRSIRREPFVPVMLPAFGHPPTLIETGHIAEPALAKLGLQISLAPGHIGDQQIA